MCAVEVCCAQKNPERSLRDRTLVENFALEKERERDKQVFVQTLSSHPLFSYSKVKCAMAPSSKPLVFK